MPYFPDIICIMTRRNCIQTTNGTLTTRCRSFMATLYFDVGCLAIIAQPVKYP